MSAVSRLRGRLTAGTILTCLQHSFHPDHVGVEVMVSAVAGRNRVVGTTATGAQAVIFLPAKSGELAWLDRNTARWPYRVQGRTLLAGHAITYRIGCRRCFSVDHDIRRGHTCALTPQPATTPAETVKARSNRPTRRNVP